MRISLRCEVARVRRMEARSSSRSLPMGTTRDRQVGDAGVGEGAQALLDGRLAAGGEDVADVGGVAVVEQALVVGGDLGLGLSTRLARAVAASISSSLQRHTGTPATMRGGLRGRRPRRPR